MMFSTLAAQGGCPCCLAFGMAARQGSAKRSAFFASAVEAPSRQGSLARVNQGSAAAGMLWLEGGSIVNPQDGSIQNMSVLVRNGLILALQSPGEPNPETDAKRIDATGKFVVPGYNDMHNHALNEPNPSGALALMLSQGVTGFRQMSGTPDLLDARRRAALPIGHEAPDLLEMPGAVLFPFTAGTKEAVVAEIQLQKQQGADFVKMGLTSAEVFWAAMQEAKRVGLPVLGHLQDGVGAREASKAGFKSVEHLGPGAAIWIDCSTNEDQLRNESSSRPIMRPPPIKIPLLQQLIMWRLQTLLINPAAFAAPDVVARLQRALDTFSDEKCQALAAGYVADRTWQVPTLVRIRHQQLADAPDYETNPELQYMPEKKVKLWRKVTKKFKALPPAMRNTYRDAYPMQLKLTKAFADAGVSMMTGSDGGTLMAPGLTLQEEFVELSKAGLSSLKILQMTTINAAEYLQRTDAMGTVAPGKNADLVLLEANPLESVDNLARIAGVVRGGEYYSRTDLDALKQRVAANRGVLH